MALPIIPKSLYPHVPKLPGVPPLIRNAASPVQAVSAFKGIAIGYFQRFVTTESKWGIYTQQGEKLVEPDSFLELGYTNKNTISKHPVQQGGFADYNKVASPYQVTIRMVKSGSLNLRGEIGNALAGGRIGHNGDTQRGEFLDVIDAACKSLTLFNIITPEKTYINANLIEYSYKRTQSEGAYQIIVDLTLEEIREVSPLYTNVFVEQFPSQTLAAGDTKSPNAEPTKNDGRVQPTAPKQDLLSDIQDAINKFDPGKIVEKLKSSIGLGQ